MNNKSNMNDTLVELDNQPNNKTNTINTKKYYGSYICLVSSHLFLLASLFNYYHNNIIECISIFILYITSIFYHNNGEHNLNRIDYKTIDIYCCRIVIFICGILSLINYNIYPTLATLFISIMYYYDIAYTNILHAILIHLPGAVGFFTIYYNNYNNNTIYTNSILQSIVSYIFTIWISLLIMCCFYLLYYDFYIFYKIDVLNINIKKLKNSISKSN
jgi:hypothetical protein